jgi:hypothetical protein
MLFVYMEVRIVPTSRLYSTIVYQHSFPINRERSNTVPTDSEYADTPKNTHVCIAANND